LVRYNNHLHLFNC